MPSSATEKQKAFARAYVETGNASEAYRRAYNAENMKQEAIAVNACKLLQHAKVALMVSELQAAHMKRHEMNVDTITDMLKEDREFARQNGQAGAAVAASMGIAKLRGMIVEKRENITPPRSAKEIDARIRELLGGLDAVHSDASATAQSTRTIQ